MSSSEQPTLFPYAVPPLKPVRQPPGPGKPTWSVYKVKSPMKCDDCQQRALESLLAGSPVIPIRAAVHKRSQPGLAPRLYCYEDATLQKEHDVAMFADVATVRPAGRRRYVA